MNLKEMRLDLQKYYKYVKECKICRGIYGVDGSGLDNAKCPLCLIKEINKTKEVKNGQGKSS